VELAFLLLSGYEFLVFNVVKALQDRQEVARIAVDSASGLAFGLALGISGMLSPSRVRAFFDLSKAFHSWDPSLALVIGGALSVAAPLFAFWSRGEQCGNSELNDAPLLTASYQLAPRNKAVDLPLVLGAALFGLGWGCVGFCPGPALVSLGASLNQAKSLVLPVVLFNFAMASGWALYYRSPWNKC
jgi:uncharacterized membrane protein YedE/YeeE